MGTPNQPQWISAEDVQHMIDSQLQALEERHQEEVSALRAELTARPETPTGIPENAGGPGTEVSETWSYAEQQAAHAAREAALASK
jgi:benzoyl-CoA reductase/2-hydroxyglutaryl-CoA dehydratase subunit BcrC/BadD/HgdB